MSEETSRSLLPSTRWILLDLPNDAAEGDFTARLSPAERSTFASLAFPQRRRKWLAGRLAAKALVRDHVRELEGETLDDSSITIANDASGAPYAEVPRAGRLRCSISISHRLPWAVAALSSRAAVGIDLERIEMRSDGWCADYFTASEMESLARDPEGRLVAEARIWSAKEAVLKALGLGLRVDTRNVEVDAPTEPPRPGWRSFTARCHPELEAGAIETYVRVEQGHVVTLALRAAG